MIDIYVCKQGMKQTSIYLYIDRRLNRHPCIQTRDERKKYIVSYIHVYRQRCSRLQHIYIQSLQMKIDAYWVTCIYLYICIQTNQTKQFKSQYAKSRHQIKHFTMNKAVQTFDKSKPSILPVIRIFVSRERGSEGY